MQNPDFQKFVKTVIIFGWLALLLSSTCVYISTQYMDTGPTINYALWFFVARLFGIGAFIVGVFCLFNQRWNNATLLIAGSVGLPFVSFIIYGKI
jgi:hypothetical protein